MDLLRHRRPVDMSLRTIDILDDCTCDELRLVERNSARLQRPAGCVLFRETEIQREVVALVDGAVAVSVAGVPTGVLRSGAAAGSAHSLGRHRWPATGTTSCCSVVLVLSLQEVAQIVKDVPRLAPRFVPFEWATAALADHHRVDDAWGVRAA